ncbi:AGAP010201-PA-like protein [Anopheles sinensis]|uniref:AGAP010201-PA-like protein n=1 Tax=Anopheles sinensis TaxID=74873 RepID=A0A084W612_ANOSI|nr:AGAP010201-PA-like protein [Anopheles sinensis]
MFLSVEISPWIGAYRGQLPTTGSARIPSVAEEKEMKAKLFAYRLQSASACSATRVLCLCVLPPPAPMPSRRQNGQTKRGLGGADRKNHHAMHHRRRRRRLPFVGLRWVWSCFSASRAVCGRGLRYDCVSVCRCKWCVDCSRPRMSGFGTRFRTGLGCMRICLIVNDDDDRRVCHCGGKGNQAVEKKFSACVLWPRHLQAAILQQTAEYIYSLEQEKTRLLSQNCQLKRLLDQQDHNGDSASQVSSPAVTGSTIVATGNGGSVVSQQTGTVVTTVAKKRKIDTIVTVQPVSDSSDEGLGSMSPEPVTLRGVSVTTASNGNNVSSATTATTNSSSGNNGRQCTTVNFSVKDFLELKHQLDVERRQKSIVEDRLKALERQLYPTRVQYQDSSDLHVPSGDCSATEQQQQPAPEEVAVSIIHKPIVAGSVVGGKLSRGGQELDGGMSVISLDSNSLGKGQQIVVCPTELIEEALSMQTASGGAPTKQLLIPLKDEKKMFIKRSRSRSPTVGNGGEPTVVTLPPKKNRFPSILEAAIKAEPKVEVERISSPSSIVVTDDQMIVTSAGSHMTQVQQPPINIYHRHNLETIVEAIRHLEGDAFDKVLPAQQQQQQSSLHQSQPQPTQSASQSTIQQRPVQDVPLALTTSKQQQQQQQQQPKTDRDHRQSQLEPYLKFRTTPGSTTTGTATTVAIVASADPNNIVTVAAAPPQAASSIISVSIAAATGSSSHPTATSAAVCHSPAASSTTASTIVANGSAATASSIPQQHTQQTTAAQILQQQHVASSSSSPTVTPSSSGTITLFSTTAASQFQNHHHHQQQQQNGGIQGSKATPLLVSVSSNVAKLKFGPGGGGGGGPIGVRPTAAPAAATAATLTGGSGSIHGHNGGVSRSHANVVIKYQKTIDGA